MEIKKEELTKMIGDTVVGLLDKREEEAKAAAEKVAQDKTKLEENKKQKEDHEKEIARKAVEEFLKSIPAERKTVYGFPTVLKKDPELTLGKFLIAVAKKDSALIQKNWGSSFIRDEKTIVEGTTTSGGYLVPPEWAQELTRNIEDESVLRKYCKHKTMATNVRKDPIVTAGVTSYFIDEESEKTKSDWTLGQIEHNAKKLCTLTPFSDEALEDSDPSAESIIMEEFRISIANKEDTDMFNGTGASASDPWTGIINLSSVVSKPMVGGIDFDALFTVIGIILSNRAKNITIFYNPVIEGLLRKAKGNDGQYLWTNATAATPNYFGGYPMVKAMNIPKTLGAAGDETNLVLGDFSNAEIADRKVITIARGYADQDFEKDRTTFRAVRRVSFKVHSSRENRFAIVTGIKVPS